jgi:type 1 glutamine amidotransferase
VIDEARLREVFNIVEPMIEDRWGIPVMISDVPHPFTGDLDGERILLDYENNIEEAVFILVHLFGHTVQWNLSERSREIAFMRPGQWSEAQLQELADYEREACCYSLQLLHDAGVHDLDQWVSDFAACDGAYLMHFYRTGEKPPFKSFWRDGAPLVTPLAIPVFQPTRWISRYDGTVI